MSPSRLETDAPRIARPLSVANPSFLILKTADSVPVHQFIRELTQNAIDAGATSASWEIDDWWAARHTDHGPKLCIVDNGHGMDREQLELYIGGFASSSRVQDRDANFGVGAKLAAARFSPFGVVYRTWVGGTGALCILVMDAGIGVIGLQAVTEAGDAVAPLSMADAPSEIQRSGHGTVVTLLGSCPEDDTTENPGLGGGQSWVGQQLARRYFRLPQNTCVSTLERTAIDIRTNEVLPQEAHINARCSGNRGSVHVLESYTVHWWLLDERGGKGGVREQINPSVAQVGVLLGSEVYDLKVGGQARHHMQRFGIRVGADRVALYIEPDQSLRPSPNLQRTRVELPGGADLPFEEIGDAFIENMPVRLAEYVRSKSAEATFNPEQVAERLAVQLGKMGVGRYRRAANGTVYVDPDDFNGLSGPPVSSHSTANGSAPGGTTGKPAGGRGDAASATTAGDRARSMRIRVPQTIMCSDEGLPNTVPLSEVGSRIEDRAGVYVGGVAPVLYVNLDFRAYRKLEEATALELLSEAEFTSRPELVRQWVLPVYIEGLLEAVIAGQLLSGHWTPEDKTTLVSPEALTLAALQRGYAQSIAKARRPR